MEGAIKLTAEDNLFYDSIGKVYRYRMHCPQCKKPSGCRCFPDLEEAETATMEDCDYACSSKCAVIYSYENNDAQIEEALQGLGFRRPIKELTEEETTLIIPFLYTNEKDEVRDAIDFLEINKHISQLDHSDKMKIIEYFEECDILDACDSLSIEMQKPIEDLTEEEAKKVLEMSDIDFDSPNGESC